MRPTNIQSTEKIYLDANFLIAYFIPNHIDYAGSRKLFFEFISNQNELFLSNLGIDELLYKIFRASESKNKTTGFSKYASKFETILKEFKKNPDNFKFIEFKKAIVGADNAVANIKNYDLAPRDAFHLAYMQEVGISSIATKDKNFGNIPGIKVFSY